jgi:hypothetical protein
MEMVRDLGCDHVLGLGPDKPMGYLPIDYFGVWTPLSVEEVERRAARAGIATRRFSAEQCRVGYRGALYAWSPAALAAVLDDHGGALAAAGWPSDPDGFVEKCASGWVADDHPVRELIARAFGAPSEIDRIAALRP